MPNTTTNLGLKKPLITEDYDVAIVTNDNADLLDADIGSKLYTENNYIVDDESLTSSIDKLDVALKDVADSVGGDIDAVDVTFTPYGNIVATDVQGAISALDTEKAPLESPALTGTPTAPTQLIGENSTKLATTAFVKNEIADDAPLKSAFAGTLINYIWSGTQVQYDAITTKDANTLYFVV
jgi:hypothetical protein